MEPTKEAPEDGDRALRQLAATQLGVVNRRQALDILPNHQAIDHRLARAEWVTEGPRVLRHVAAPTTPHQQALAAVVDAGEGAALSHASAAALWGLPGCALVPPTSPSTGGRIPSATRSGPSTGYAAFSESALTTLDGIPVVRPELLMLQLCATVSPGRAERLLDRAWSMRLLSGASTQRVLDEMAGSGVHGVTVLRSCSLTEAPATFRPRAGSKGASPRCSGAPAPNRWNVRSTWAIPTGAGASTSSTATTDWWWRSTASGTTRRSAIVRATPPGRPSWSEAGFTVLRFTDFQVFHRPGEVVERVRRARSPSRR